ncbi:MAG: CHASE2 domain-containing protein [Candidatus Lokiarchaeota archaeon]|nr:CHASE2 domain-containing protein [Candidatus Lokiarchaeota archaeon]
MWNAMFRFIKTKIMKTLTISIIVAFILSILLSLGFFDTWESKISDSFYNQDNTLDDIIIVAIDDKSLQELGRWPWPRDYFAYVIERLNRSSVIGIDISFIEATEDDQKFADSIKNNNVVLAMEYTSFSIKNGQLFGENLIKPSSTLGDFNVDYKSGFVNLYTDSDGVTRSFIPKISGVEDHNHFSLVVVNEFTRLNQNLGDSRMLINYYSPPGGYEYVSFSDIYNNITSPSYFENKIVLIGATAADLHDNVIVPISKKLMPGVEVNANLVQSILTQDFLNYQDDVSTILLILIFAIITGLIVNRFKIHIASLLLAGLGFFYIIIGVFIYDFGLILNILYPIIAIVSVYVALVIFYYITEERSRKWITSVFGKYVSPVVIDNLIKNPDSINLGGEKRNITIFFSDIRKFTSISEKLEPEELVHILNEYFSEMTSIIIENHGLVDKFMGDAIMAFWGAPLELDNHSEIACSCSLKMIGKLKELHLKWRKEKIPILNIGIGINSGQAIIGNMGSFDRFDYTAIGDNVNLASRLEGLNKIYGTNIIISQFTQNKVKDKFETRKLDAVRVKGKKKPIFIFELISYKNQTNKKQQEFIKNYETGLEHYFKQNWKSAIESFEKSILFNKDIASKIFIDRCKEFIQNPPSKDWDGVWEMKTK